MVQRHNHYEAAFEEFLRWQRTPYVSVDEQRRSLLADASLKSMDFIVYSGQTVNLLVDVKGKRYPSGVAVKRHTWENWATADDVDSLLKWEQVFGAGFRALFVFAYHVVDSRRIAEFEQCFQFRGETYAFYGVWADQYRDAMTVRSKSWDTVSLPSRTYRELKSPILTFL